MSDDRIEVRASFTLAALIAAGGLTFTITQNLPDPEPEPLPSNSDEPQGEDQ